MCAGIALPLGDLPEALLERCRLADRIVRREPQAGPEVQFLCRHPRPLLPVWHGRQLCIVEWGNADHRVPLPRTPWCQSESIEAGLWQQLAPERVEIPAAMGLEKGVWFQIQEGIEGLLVRDPRGRPHVYMLTEPASYYYRIMTRSQRMPVLLGKRI
jgi:hypothetical protein